MYVTSDIYDLKRISRFRKFDWRENLVGGVAVHGTHWRGYQAGARFLLEATQRCGIPIDSMGYASYSRPGEERTHSIKAKSFEKLVRGELAGARNAGSGYAAKKMVASAAAVARTVATPVRSARLIRLANRLGYSSG